jgi:hypothetical protein
MGGNAKRFGAMVGRTAIKLQKRFRGRSISHWKGVKLQRILSEYRRNRLRDLEDAKLKTKQNYYRLQAVIQRDPCEDMDDNAGVAYDWYQYWDEEAHRWMWWSGAPLVAKRHWRHVAGTHY